MNDINESAPDTPQAPLLSSLNDRFNQKLDEKIKILQSCQKDKHYSSCMDCNALLDCEIRDNYVKAVYESMSKGQQGYFDFN